MEGGRGVGFGCGRLFEFEWKGEGVAAYSWLGAYQLFLPLGWAFIRGWALIRINTECCVCN